MKTLPEIGEWVFITGSSQISDEKWKQSFPQNIFGRVIGYQKRFNGRVTYVMVRCYMKSRSRDRRNIQTHIKAEKKYIEIYKT